MAKKQLASEVKEYNEFLLRVGDTYRCEEFDLTHDGYPLSAKESKFISIYIGTGNYRKSLKDSCLTNKYIMSRDYILEEVKYRLAQLRKETIADADEIMQYFTAVMRGEIKDQFGLEAPLSERTAAAKELAKRIIDIDTQEAQPEIKISLDWNRSATPIDVPYVEVEPRQIEGA